jgi:hypothetical protein
MPSQTATFRSGRTYWAILAFLLGFAILLVGVLSYYLVPAMDAATSKGITVTEKRTLVAYSRLLLMVVLFVLFAGLIMTFRVGRFFFPSKNAERVQTKYVDAWAEAGRRLEPPGDEES